MTRLGTYLLLMAWGGDDYRVIDRNLSISDCTGQAAMARMQDDRRSYRCEIATYNAFRIFIRTEPEDYTQ